VIGFLVNYIVQGGSTMKTEFADKYITMGLKIAYYRKKAGYTQEYFAELIDKSVNFVGQVEGTGTVRGVSLETLFKMAEVLNTTPSKLLEED
jgi:transcriptional regulator with XRE-family HTH domain